MNRFPRVRGVRLGYDPAQVDELVRRIEGTLGRTDLDGSPITADEIRSAAFRVKRGGYNETAVDFALDAFIVAVEALSGRPAHSDGAARSGDPGADHPPSSDPALAGTEAASTAPVPAETEPEDVGAVGVASPADGASSGTEIAADSVGDARSEGEAPSATPAEQAEAASNAAQAAAPSTVRDTDASGSRPESDPSDRPGDPAPATGPSTDGEVSEARPVAPGDGEFELQAERVERVAFRPGRLGMGYVEDEVDAFLDRVVATLRGTADRPVTAEEVRTATFATVVFKTGYAIADVDAFLAEIADVLERRS
ncbi:DivIVA domain-containing protein [Microtetraspora fusca]|uniref:DivIVA domain-containing protein n=1 Tax=Microtetraspora fusca TaxID=1997 RepID=A0ABW6VHH2_MICFU